MAQDQTTVPRGDGSIHEQAATEAVRRTEYAMARGWIHIARQDEAQQEANLGRGDRRRNSARAWRTV